MRSVLKITVSLTAAGGLILAQDAPPPQAAPQGGWTPVGQSGQVNNGQSAPAGPPYAQPAPPPAGRPVLPPQVTLRAGSYITVRVNQKLSSDKNQQGDGFTATLLRPVIADGFVVAHQGQEVGGQVAEAVKAAHGTKSRLGLQLTSMTLADGQQLLIQSALVSVRKPSYVGRDIAAVGTATGVGAIIGGAAGGGVGAAIGAGVGAVASTAAVVSTKSGPSTIKPEEILTFKLDSDLTIATDRAPQAFRPVGPADYNPGLVAGRPRPAYPYPYYAYPYPYPYYWGPGVGVYFGRRWR